MSPAPAVVLAGVHRTYEGAHTGQGATTALHGVDLTIARGELLALTGPSGSGKSTLLHLAGALDTPSEGRVHVLGTDVAALGAADRARLRNRALGFVFQAFHLSPGLSVSENVALPAILAKRPAAQIQERVAELLDLVDLSDKALSRPNQLSGGEQQRAAVARALVMDPAVLLADEPTGNLDSHAGSLVVELLMAAHSAGRTVVIATHDMRLASRAERVVHLRDGCIEHETRAEARAERGPADLIDTRPAG